MNWERRFQIALGLSTLIMIVNLVSASLGLSFSIFGSWFHIVFYLLAIVVPIIQIVRFVQTRQTKALMAFILSCLPALMFLLYLYLLISTFPNLD